MASFGLSSNLPCSAPREDPLEADAFARDAPIGGEVSRDVEHVPGIF
jgi:hypothetical protein